MLNVRGHSCCMFPFIVYGNSRALPLYSLFNLYLPAILVRVESKGHFTHETESPWPLDFKHSHWWKKAEPVQDRYFTLRLKDQRSRWMQDDGCKVYMESYMASNGLCFMVTWTVFKNHLLEVGPTQNRGDDRTPNAHNYWFILFYHVWVPAWIETHWGPGHMWLHTTLENPWLHYMILEVYLGWPLDTFFWAPTISWSWLLACVWSGPKYWMKLSCTRDFRIIVLPLLYDTFGPPRKCRIIYILNNMTNWLEISYFDVKCHFVYTMKLHMYKRTFYNEVICSQRHTIWS